MKKELVEVVDVLQAIIDPEININIYDLGLVYNIAVDGERVDVLLTFTSPSCPFGDVIIDQIIKGVENIDWVDKCDVEITFEPQWSKSMMSEEALIETGLL